MNDAKNSVCDRLSVRQIEVLDYVARGYNSDEIARELGVTTAAVNDRIKQARTKLGGIRRSTAARLVREELQRNPCSFGDTPTPLGDAGEPLSVDARLAAAEGGELREIGTPFDGRIPVRSINGLGVRKRSLSILLMVAAIMIVLVLLRPMAEGMGWLTNTVARIF